MESLQDSKTPRARNNIYVEDIVGTIQKYIDVVIKKATITKLMHLILGLFGPARFGIPEYDGYNIAKL